MPTNTLHTNPGQQGDYSQLPFGELLQRLHANGFIVDAADYTEFAAIFDQLQPGSTSELKYYLAPVICRNADEQKKFYQVFDTFIEENTTSSKISTWQKWRLRVRHTPWLRWLLLVVVVLTFALILLLYNSGPGVHKPLPPSICFNNDLRAKESNFFSSYCDLSKQDTAARTARWYFGDSAAPVTGNQVPHTFAKHGQYKIRLVTNNADKSTTTIDTLVNVCPERAEVSVTASGIPGDSIIFKINSIDPSIALSSCYWTVINGSTNETDTLHYDAHGHLPRYVGQTPGVYKASFWYPGSCSTREMSVNIEDPKQYTLSVTSNGPPFPVNTHVSIVYTTILLLIAIAALIMAGYLKRKRTPPSPFQNKIDTTQYEGMEPPFEISYLPKDNQVQTLLDISKVSYNLSRRTEADLPELNVPGTIHRSIRNFDYVTPVYQNRQRPREYLILIDDSNAHNQQTYLFSYLVKKFVKENVLIDLYTYHRTPGRFYKANQQTPVNFARLRDCNYYASLIIISKGYELLDNNTGTIRADYRADLEWWEKRVLVTPVPAKDWSVSEQTLAGFFHLVPADMSGWISLAQFITEDAVLYRFTDEAWQTYKVKFEDTVNIKGLRDYLGDEDLFQWLCATAIYHHIRWEILIQLGYAVLSNRNKTYKLNYTNLLKLARISWMEEGKFPAATRLALLKELTVENELIARKAMLELLKESDGEITMASFSYEEKQIQKHTDGFLLYANNANANAMYAEDANNFMALWTSSKIMDNPLRIYLQPENNGWRTPIRSIKNNGTPIGIQEYIQEHREEAEKNTATIKRSYRRWATACLLLAVTCMTALFAYFIFKDQIAKLKINNWFGFVSTSVVSPADISITIPYRSCIRQFAQGADSVTISFDPLLGRTQSITTKDFSTQTTDTFPYQFKLSKEDISRIAGKEMKITVIGNGNNRTISGTVNFNSSAYTLSLTGTDCNYDTIKLFYFPYETEDFETIESQLRKNLPQVHIETKHIQVSNFNTPANYIEFGSQVNSLERFEIATQVKRSGIAIKQVREVNFSDSSIDTSRIVVIIGDEKLKNRPVLSDDSLRCLLLGQCKTTTSARPMVYLQYDPQAASDTMELFRRSLVASGWNAPGIERKTYNYASAVRYFNPAQKSYADTIALLASRFFNQPIKSQFVTTRGTPMNPLELWYKPGCETVNYSDVYKNLEVPYIRMRNPNLQYIFSANQIGILGIGKGTGIPNKSMNKCGNVYTLPISNWINIGSVGPNVDTISFTFSRKSIAILTPKNSLISGTGTVIFDFSNFSRSNTAFTDDLGIWQYVNEAANNVTINDRYVKFQTEGSLIGITSVMIDKITGCRIYIFFIGAGSQLLIVYDGSDGKYISPILTSNASDMTDVKSILINAWGQGVQFTKIVKAASTTQTPNNEPMSQTTIPAQKKILWIDFSYGKNEMLIDSLRRMGFSVQTSSNSKDAISSLSDGKFDLVISDLANAYDSTAGLQLLREIRSYNKPTPVFIYTTPVSAKKYQQQAIKEGALGVYSDPASLFGNVRGYLIPSKAKY